MGLDGAAAGLDQRHVGELDRADDLEARAEGDEVGLVRVAQRGVMWEARGREHLGLGIGLGLGLGLGVGVGEG